MSSFWDQLEERERAALRRAARPRGYPAKTPLMYQGDESTHVIVIQHGWTKVTSATEDGHEVVLAVRGPGDLVGESAVLGGRRRSATITALSPVQALVIPAGRFTEFLEEHSRVWQVISSTFLVRLDAANRRLQAHVTATGTRRLALLLADLAEVSAQHSPPRDSGEIDIAPPLSQKEIGSWMDASRETVARSMGELRHYGVIVTGWRKITVVNLAGLRAVAAGHPALIPATRQPSLDAPEQRSEPPEDDLPEGIDQLTAAERRVASLAAQCSTNRQIAKELQITVSTVEQHLVRVYRKLNVSRRADLPREHLAVQHPAAVLTDPHQLLPAAPTPSPSDGAPVPAFPLPAEGDHLPTWAGHNCTILFADITRFSAAYRDDADRWALRRAMDELLHTALQSAGMARSSTYVQDRGDGMLIVIPPQVPIHQVLNAVFPHLAAGLRRHNEHAGPAEHLQLRVAVHVGPVQVDAGGVGGLAIIHAARLLDTPALKRQVIETQADLGLITSVSVYDAAIAHASGQLSPASFRPVTTRAKEHEFKSWIYVGTQRQLAMPPSAWRR